MRSSPTDYKAAARRRLPRFLFDYLDGGSGTESTLDRNTAQLGQTLLKQRVLCNVADVDVSAALLGTPYRLPLVLGPVGIAGMYRRRGECQAARAAQSRNIAFCLSTVSLCSLEEVTQASGTSPWLQLYVMRDRAFMNGLLRRAIDIGCRTLVFTVDMPVPGLRHRDAASGMSGRYAPVRRLAQAISHPRWAIDVGIFGRPHRLGNLAPVLGRQSGLGDYMGWLGANFDPGIVWDDLKWLRDAWPGQLVIKGILEPEDAEQAVGLGSDGIVVSNHGGRQLDGTKSTIEALPKIAQVVRGRTQVLVDSGIRSGVDVVRMLASGADGVLLGRAWVYALAAAGEAGVAALIGALEQEIRVTLALCGVRSIGELGPQNLVTFGDEA